MPDVLLEVCSRNGTAPSAHPGSDSLEVYVTDPATICLLAGGHPSGR